MAEQIPTKLVPDVVKNTALKIVHRLPAEDDRQLVGAAMNLSEEQSRQVVSLQPGHRRGVRRRDGPAAARPGAAGRAPRATDARPACRRSAAAVRRPAGSSAGPARRARWSSCARPTCSPTSPEWAWLRIWTDTLVLAYCTNRPLPGVPRVLADAWAELPVSAGASACWPRGRTGGGPPGLVAAHVSRPGILTEQAAEVATRLLGPDTGAPASARGPPGSSRRSAGCTRWTGSSPTASPAPNLRSPAPAWSTPLFPTARRRPSAVRLGAARPPGQGAAATTRCPWRWTATGRWPGG